MKKILILLKNTKIMKLKQMIKIILKMIKTSINKNKFL